MCVPVFHQWRSGAAPRLFASGGKISFFYRSLRSRRISVGAITQFCPHNLISVGATCPHCPAVAPPMVAVAGVPFAPCPPPPPSKVAAGKHLLPQAKAGPRLMSILLSGFRSPRDGSEPARRTRALRDEGGGPRAGTRREQPKLSRESHNP